MADPSIAELKEAVDGLKEAVLELRKADPRPDQVTITLKGGPGHEAPWIVIHGNSADHAGQIMAEMREAGMLEGVHEAALEFRGVGAVPQPPAPAYAPAPAPAGGLPGQPGPGAPCPTCGGPTVWKEGTIRNGPRANQPYKGWFCADTTARGHKVQWA